MSKKILQTLTILSFLGTTSGNVIAVAPECKDECTRTLNTCVQNCWVGQEIDRRCYYACAEPYNPCLSQCELSILHELPVVNK